MENKLQQILWAVYREEYSEFEQYEQHIFSKRHNDNMREIKSLYYKKRPALKIKKIIVIAVAAVLTAVLLAVTTMAILNGGLRFSETQEYTLVEGDSKTENTHSYIYIIKGIPEDYVPVVLSSESDYYETMYTYNEKYLYFKQVAKDIYSNTYNTEKYPIQQIIINNKTAYYMDCDDIKVVFWEENGYVLELFGNLTKEEFVELAESTEFQENEINNLTK